MRIPRAACVASVTAGRESAGVAMPGIPSEDGSFVVDDASGSEAVPVRRHWTPGPRAYDAYVDGLRRELRDARAAGRPVAVGGARHSMGGQSMARDGTAVTPACHGVEVDAASKVARVWGGARWSDMVGALAPLGLSPGAMQSNHDFGVLAATCVNAHGWAVPHGTVSSTVRSLRVMLADGEVVECSREVEPDLFAHVVGGYGLVGVVVGADLDVVEDALLEPDVRVMQSEDVARAFDASVHDGGVSMAYGRLSPTSRGFLDEATMVAFRRRDGGPGTMPAPGPSAALRGATRAVYRSQPHGEAFKALRWALETRVAPLLLGRPVTRNALLSRPVSDLARRDTSRVDVLHEYFVPPGMLDTFLCFCRDIVPDFGIDFLNVTLRWVGAVKESVLSYAPGPRVALVMSFSQRRTPEGEAAMLLMTASLVEAVLSCGGAHYLPYRLHATREQVHAAYPRAAAFARRKRELDPGLLFRNRLWDAYLA